jgi:hypothetical protein
MKSEGFPRGSKNLHESFLAVDQQGSIRAAPEFGFISLKG